MPTRWKTLLHRKALIPNIHIKGRQCAGPLWRQLIHAVNHVVPTSAAWSGCFSASSRMTDNVVDGVNGSTARRSWRRAARQPNAEEEGGKLKPTRIDGRGADRRKRCALQVAQRNRRASPGPICSSAISASRDARSSRCASISPPVTSRPGTPSGRRDRLRDRRVLEYQLEGKPVTLKAGDVLFIPAGAIHPAKNVGSSNGAELATYIVEKGKPLVMVVK